MPSLPSCTALGPVVPTLVFPAPSSLLSQIPNVFRPYFLERGEKFGTLANTVLSLQLLSQL